MLASTSPRSAMSQKGCAQTATPPAAWIASSACGDSGRLAQRERRTALDQVGPDQRADVVDLLGLPGASALAGAASTAAARWGRPIGWPSAMRAEISRSSSSKPSSRERGGHAQRALLAVGQELGRARAERPRRCGRCGSRGRAVRAARRRRRRSTESSTAGTTCTPQRSPAASASSTPSTVSWSVSASSSTPASAARWTTSAALSAPSECVECDWRSNRGATGRSVCNRLRGAPVRARARADRLTGSSPP